VNFHRDFLLFSNEREIIRERRSFSHFFRRKCGAALGQRPAGRGALGHCSHLSTRHFKAEELIELCKVAGKYQQSSPPYPSKPNLLEAFDELLRTARESDLPAEVYHIKTAGQKNKPASQLWLGW
jgi:hypothetical protein